MKKTNDEMCAEYKRTDFAKLERGKFYKEIAKGISVVLLDPAIAKVLDFGSRKCSLARVAYAY